MFYKVINKALAAISLVLAFVIFDAKAQGLVSLSEDAMFNDELESNAEVKPEPEVKQEEPENKEDLDNNAEKEVLPVLSDDIKEAEVLPAVLPDVQLPASAGALKAENKEDEITFSAEEFRGDLFSKLSDLEKKTTLMNLELRREKLQNEIEAVKNQRRQAIQQEKEREEAARLKALEKEKEAEKKLLEEQQKLRALDLKFEALRQEKILGEYKNKMLEETQKWIEHDRAFYKQIDELRQSKVAAINALDEKMKNVKKEALLAQSAHISKVDAMNKEKEDLQQQINILKERIVFMEKQREEDLAAAAAAAAAAKRNPFADDGTETSGAEISTSGTMSSTNTAEAEPVKTALTELYAITEIRGKGDELVAKLINKNGTSFYVKKGTALQSGHIIKEITSTYVMAERLGEKDYLYFAAGGILPSEASNFKIEKDDEEE